MLDPEALCAEYASGMSIRDLSKKYEVHPEIIRRSLKANGATLRTKSEAQKLIMESGRVEHPTKGKPRPDEVKQKVSKALVGWFERLTDEEKDAVSKRNKEIWHSRSPADIAKMTKMAMDAVRLHSKDGSKLEELLFKELTDRGFIPTIHLKNFVGAEQLEIDIYIPSCDTVIEIDGLAHFEPIWGEKKFKSTKKSDMKKNALLIAEGTYVIRIHYKKDKLTLFENANLIKNVESTLNKIVKERQSTPKPRVIVIKYQKEN